MKRIFATILIVSIMLSCSGCFGGKVTEVTQAIDAIGTVTTGSEGSIAHAESLYAALSDNQRAKVENADLLKTARETYEMVCVTDRFAHNAQSFVDGGHTFILEDGSQIVLEETFVEARMTFDCKHIILLAKDGTLFVCDTDRADDRTVVAEDATYLQDIRNEGFFYDNEQGELIRYTFADGAQTNIGTYTLKRCAEHSLSLVALANSNIMVLPADAAETGTIKVCENHIEHEEHVCSEDVGLIAISNDGKTVVWTETDDPETYTRSTYLYTEGAIQKLCTYQGSPTDAYAQIGYDSKMLFVYNESHDRVFLKAEGEEIQETQLLGQPRSLTVFCKNGSLETSLGIQDGVYLLAYTQDELQCQLYFISRNGDRERVLTDVKEYDMAGDKIFYRTSRNELYAADIDGATLSDIQMIDDWTNLYAVSKDGSHVYFIKSQGGNTRCSLYHWDMETTQAVLISDQAYNSFYSDPFGINTFQYLLIPADNTGVYYLSNVQEIPNSNDNVGDLMFCPTGGEPVTIATEVVAAIPGRFTTLADKLLISKFVSNEGRDIVVDKMYYDGEAAEIIAQGLELRPRAFFVDFLMQN